MDANRITKILQIEGMTAPGEDRPDRLERLQRDNQRLEEQLAEAQTELTRLRGDNAKAIAAISYLQGQLLPLYNGLRAIWGQIDLVVGPDPSATPSVAQPRSNQKWEKWKKDLPGRPAEFIDLLLLHEEMSVKQFMAAAHCGKDTVYTVMSKLGKAGLVSNSGGKYRLRDI